VIPNALEYGVGTCSPRLPVVHQAWVDPR